MSLRTSRTLLRTVVLAFCALPIYGQTVDTGSIVGTVSDPSRALVPHAAAVINSQGTGEKRDLAADAGGSFSSQFLPPGNYDLAVSAAGFEPFSLKGVQVQVTEVSKAKIPLALGDAKEQIAVSAAPPLLQTENATLGRVIDRNTIEELPPVNRNFTETLVLTSGTNTAIVDATQLWPEARRSTRTVRAAVITKSCPTVDEGEILHRGGVRPSLPERNLFRSPWKSDCREES